MNDAPLPHPELAGATTRWVRGAAALEALIADEAPTDVDVVVLDGALAQATDPLVAMGWLRDRCRTAVLVRTAGVAVGGLPDRCLWRFDERDGWLPTRPGLVGLCRAAGFSRVEVLGPRAPAPAPGTLATDALEVLAWR